jgi:hypothetical protein
MSCRHIPAALKLGLLWCYVRAGGGPTSPLHKTIYPSLGTRFFPPRSLARPPFRVALTARDSHDSAHPFTGRERERERKKEFSFGEKKYKNLFFKTFLQRIFWPATVWKSQNCTLPCTFVAHELLRPVCGTFSSLLASLRQIGWRC